MSAANKVRPGWKGHGSPWILSWLDRLPAGARVLDFAAGGGRHARAAAQRGFSILAVDRDAVALGRCQGVGPSTGDDPESMHPSSTAAQAPAAVQVPSPIDTRVADLERGPWPFGPDERFDAVIVANYLFRPRFALLAALVAPGGFLIYETFARGNEVYGRPSNPAYLLEAGELLVRARQAGLTALDYATGLVPGTPPALIQRLCAIRATGVGARVVLG